MRILVQILTRQAIRAQPADPRGWLTDLQATKWDSLNKQNGHIVGTALNGKSITIQALPGTTLADIIMATEVAIQTIDAGLTSPRTETVAYLR